MKRKYLISLCLSLLMTFFTTSALAQSKVVKGTVVDELGEPIIGATVRVAGTKTATVTDFDGNYQIEVPKDGTITVSYIGYKETQTAGGQLKLEPESNDLEEVVVVGYGTQKKAHLTGAIATVDMNDIQDIANGDLASSLSGLVNGLSVSSGSGSNGSMPGERMELHIRDVTSFADVGVKPQEPLFVIDGFIYPNDVKVGRSTQNLGAEAFSNLDASEIESISVLKDAAAAVYGARAANGVILVTTKKGKLGAPTINYSGSFGFTDAVSTPKMLSAYNYGRLYNISAMANDLRSGSLNHTTGLYQADELEAMKGLNYDLLDKYWKTGFTQKHSINVSGATEKASYFAGISYFDQDGNLGNLDYNRWNYRAGVDVKISQYLSANLSVSGDYGKREKPYGKISSDRNVYDMLLTHPRYIPEYVSDFPIASYGISNTGGNMQQYSFDVLEHNGDFSKEMTSNTSMNGSLKYDFGWSKILKGLSVSFSYSKSINTTKTNQYGSAYNIYYLTSRFGSGSHLYTPIGTESEEELAAIYGSSNIESNRVTADNGNMLTRMMVRSDSYQMNFTLNYARDFGKHHVGALFSIEKSESEAENNYAYVSEPYAFTTYQSYSALATTKDVEFVRSESGTLSYIGRVNYAYADRYLFEFLLRSDASTKFAPENYWGTFPAISAGWVISEEPWFQNIKWLKWMDYMKIRASWGMTGRDNTEPWQWMQVYSQNQKGGVIFGEGSSISTNNPIIIDNETAAVNRDIHWDKSYKTNVGFDFQLLNRRLAIGLDYYYEKNREMLLRLSQEVPTTVGTRSAATNLGEIDNWGWELSLTWRDKIGKDFKYSIGLNTGISDNKVKMMDWEDDYIYRQITYGNRTDLGLWGMQCIGMFRSFQDIDEYFDKYMVKADGTYGTYMGLPKDKVRPGMLIYKDIRGAYNSETGTYDGPDGIVDEANDMVHLSNRSNPYHITLNLKGEWKGIALTAQLNAQWGGYTTIDSYALKPTVGNSASSLEYANMPSFWDPDNVFVYEDIYDGSGNLIQKANRDAYYPVLPDGDYGINSTTSSFWRVSDAKVTLSRLTLSYGLPSKWLKNTGIKSVRFNVTGQNLINFYNPLPDKFYSPMAGKYGYYPVLRQWNIGVNLSF